MAWSLFGRKASPSQLPKESFLGLHLETDGSADVWLVNKSLLTFEEKASFPWQLSILIEMEDALPIGLPSKAEQQVLAELGAALAAGLKANDNALFVGSGSWKGARTLIYHVRDPEGANRFLTDFVASAAATRAMEYRMEQDPGWKRAGIYLEAARVALQ